MENPTQSLIEQLSAMAAQATELERLKRLEADQRYHLVVVPRSGAPLVHEFDSLELMADHMRGLLRQEVQAFMFHGHRLAVTRGPHKYVVGTNGVRVPLFQADVEDVDPDGWLTDAECETLPSAAPDPPADPPLTPPPPVSN